MIERVIKISQQRDQGWKAVRKAVRLSVTAPFHCSILEPAKARLAEALEQTDFRVPGDNIAVLSNVTGNPLPLHDPNVVRSMLVQQLVSPVQWAACMRTCAEMNISTFVEFGPDPPYLRNFLFSKDNSDVKYESALALLSKVPHT